MASTSTSRFQKRFKYDVFLSFRGEDVRKTFVDHLYLALHHRGITTYKDDEKIEKGERIDDQLIRSIEDSRLYIIVFSKNYASSSWCLDELAKIMECQKMTEHTAYPVFYDVEPREIRKQRGAVREAFAKHVGNEAAERWRDALKEAAALAGWELKNTVDGHEGKFIQKIIEKISPNVDFIKLSIDENLVGMEIRLKKVMASLEAGSGGVLMIGIKGIGGGGKTTLARVVFDHISGQFEGKSFVANVREVSTGSSSGLQKLQKQVLKDVSNEKDIVVSNIFEGKSKIKKMMRSRKVLLVIDDVDDTEQIKALVGEAVCFKPGSRIIITTRNEQLLVSCGVHRENIHDVDLLTYEEANCLLQRCALNRDIPVQGDEVLLKKVIEYAAGLPLTIKVLGTFLCGRNSDYWKRVIKRLQRIPHEETLKILELTYNDLADEYKEIFLDIACILKGELKDEAIRILKSCGYNATIGLNVLEERSLIIISDTGHLGMHDRIEEMGMHIVRRVDPDEPTRHSRLWITKEIEDILQEDSGTEAVKSIKLIGSQLSPDIIMKGLTKMKNLRLLCVDNGDQTEVYTSPSSYNYASVPKALRCVCWRGYPLSCLHKSFQAEKLVGLKLRNSNISQLWGEGERKVLTKLKFLDLKDSELKTFDLRMTLYLKMLDLSGCNEFVELNIPGEPLKLKFLNLSRSKLSILDLGPIPNLVELYLEECHDFVELRLPVECPKLKFLYITSHKAGKVNLLTSPNIEKLKSLERLILSIQDIDLLPHNICMLKHLKCLKLEYCWLLKQLPEDIGQLECLEELHLTDCRLLRNIPNSICKMKHLKYLHLPYTRVKKLPEELGCLGCLKELNLEGSCIKDLPKSIYNLKGLCIVWSRGQLLRHGFSSLKEMQGYTASCYVV